MTAKLIAIEGVDGSGKGTQSRLLADTLRSEGRRVALLSFPRYSETFFGARIGDFLNGRFGSLEAVDPFLAALLFAGDRLESKPVLAAALAENDIVVLDRYVASNVAHQGAKREGAERAELVRRIEHVEFALNALPRPDVTVWLDLPVPLATRLNRGEGGAGLHGEGRRPAGGGRGVPGTGRRGVRRTARGGTGGCGSPAPRAARCGRWGRSRGTSARSSASGGRKPSVCSHASEDTEG